jgi:hypothetical protein
MKANWFVGFAVVCASISALCVFYATQAPVKQNRYALFNPTMTAEQRIEVQQKIDRQLSRKPGGQQVSSTQVAYRNGAVVLTFPVPGDTGQSDATCDYGYFCVWEAWDFAGRKLSLLSTPTSRPVNLVDYGMGYQVSSWQHNNRIHSVKIFGVDGPSAKGNLMMSNIKEAGLGKGCCPFNIPEQPSVTGTWTEIYSQRRLVEHNDRIVSVVFSPMFILFAQ